MKTLVQAFTIFAIFFSVQTASAQISLPQLKEIQKAFHQAYDEELKEQNANMLINYHMDPKNPDYWWSLDHVHASYSSYKATNGPRTHYLFMFGGFARQKGMTVDGVALTLCHELGHGIGGQPFKEKQIERDEYVSNEGQSDYFAARHCLEKVFEHLKPSAPIAPVNDYVADLCLDRYSSEKDVTYCYRAFQALEAERIFLKTQPPYKEVHYHTPDTTTADKINTSPTFYPQAQCRLDTMIAGVLKQERPLCWWTP